MGVLDNFRIRVKEHAKRKEIKRIVRHRKKRRNSCAYESAHMWVRLVQIANRMCRLKKELEM